MASDQDPRVLRRMLPARPDPDTGKPFPPEAPTRASPKKPEHDKHRETRLSHKPDPPPGMGPVLAWHRANTRGKVFGLVFSLAFLAGGGTVIFTLQGDPPLEWLQLRYWPLWIIVVGGSFLMSKPWQMSIMSAGADWVKTENARRNSKNIVLRFYELVEVGGSVAVGRIYLRLRDRDDNAMDMLLTQWQRDQRIWDLVYNGILHSVADGAKVDKGVDKTLRFDDSPAMRLNRQYPVTPAPHLTEPRDATPRPTVDLPTYGRTHAEPSYELTRKSGTLRGSPELHGGSVWLERQDGTTLPVIWPNGFRARFNPLELLDADGRVIARDGDKIILTGTYQNRTPGSEQAFAAHTVDAV